MRDGWDVIIDMNQISYGGLGDSLWSVRRSAMLTQSSCEIGRT